MGRQAHHLSRSQTLTSAEDRRPRPWLPDLMVPTSADGFSPRLSLLGLPPFAIFSKAVGWVLLPTISQQDGGKSASEGNRKKGGNARVVSSWCPEQPPTTKPCPLSLWPPSEGPLTLGKMNPETPPGASPLTRSPLHPLLVYSQPL